MWLRWELLRGIEFFRGVVRGNSTYSYSMYWALSTSSLLCSVFVRDAFHFLPVLYTQADTVMTGETSLHLSTAFLRRETPLATRRKIRNSLKAADTMELIVAGRCASSPSGLSITTSTASSGSSDGGDLRLLILDDERATPHSSPPRTSTARRCRITIRSSKSRILGEVAELFVRFFLFALSDESWSQNCAFLQWGHST